MGIWTSIKEVFGFSNEKPSCCLPKVEKSFPMPPCKTPRKPAKRVEVEVIVKEEKKPSERKLSTEMPKAVKPRIKRINTDLEDDILPSAATLLAGAATNVANRVEESLEPQHVASDDD